MGQLSGDGIPVHGLIFGGVIWSRVTEISLTRWDSTKGWEGKERILFVLLPRPVPEGNVEEDGGLVWTTEGCTGRHYTTGGKEPLTSIIFGRKLP